MNEPALVLLAFDPLRAPAVWLKVLLGVPGALRPEDAPDELPPADVLVLLSEPATPRQIAALLTAVLDRWQALQQSVDDFQFILKGRRNPCFNRCTEQPPANSSWWRR